MPYATAATTPLVCHDEAWLATKVPSDAAAGPPGDSTAAAITNDISTTTGLRTVAPP
ncbi:MAG: hypothetical protein M3425_12315 [Actinomycetota bacterium]|nr:hypothetical protein [Actinomycetota bacterium]